jgi:TPR repeat protein
MKALLLGLCLFWALGAGAQQDKAKDNKYQDLMPALGALERGDYKQAIDTLRPLAADGLLEAQYVLAGILEPAPPPARDLEAAFAWYQRAAEGGHAGAQNNLGAMYYDGRGVLRNPLEAAKWYKLAADQGHAVAQTNLALMYGMGVGVPPDQAAMVKLLKTAAAGGEPRAQAQLARMYLDGDGVPQNAGEAAAQDNESAQFFLAVLLQRGIGAPRDLEAASAWFRRAANHGNRLAMLELAKAYELGLGIPADPAQAKTWREQAQKKQDPETEKKKDAAAGNQRVDPGRPRP